MSIPGWLVTGRAPEDYEFALDTAEHHSGTQSARVRARSDTPRDFGTLMQELLPDDYRGSRVRLSGWVKTLDVRNWCGLWMRVDGPNSRILAFDNMKSRPISGTTEWRQYEVVLDVDRDAIGLSFGLLHSGAGTVWLDDVALAVVSQDVPTTDEERPRAPRNLDFEEAGSDDS
jgi:hypothetical protein